MPTAFLVRASLLLLICNHALAAELTPIGPPKMGPLEPQGMPMILTFRSMRVTAYNPMSEGIVGGVLDNITQKRFDAAVAKTGETVRAGAPNLDVVTEIGKAFRCGQPGSLCSELIVLDASAPWTDFDDKLRALLKSRAPGPGEMRLLSFWWEAEKRGMLARASLAEVHVDGEKVLAPTPAMVAYALVPPKGPGAVPHANEWDYGAPVPREETLRTAIHALEPLFQMALSWGANRDPVSRERIVVHSKDVLRRYRPQGIECSTMGQCNAGFDSVSGDRVWVWDFIEPAREIKSYVAELQSRPRIDP